MHARRSSRRRGRSLGLSAALLVASLVGSIPVLLLPAAVAEEQPQPAMSPGIAVPVEADPEVASLMKELICRCGCNLSVYECSSTMTCDVADRMKAEIEADLAQGMTHDEVLEAFAADYGEVVLAVPPRKGFDLAVWILPFVALAVGGLALSLALRKWRPAKAGGPPEPPPEVDPDVAAAIEDELRREV